MEIEKIKQLHQEAIDHASEACYLETCSNSESFNESFNERIKELYKLAFEKEKQCSSFYLNRADEPTRSIIFKSAAIFAFNCGDYKSAAEFMKETLKGKPDKSIITEMLELEEKLVYKGILKEPIEDKSDKINQSFDYIEMLNEISKDFKAENTPYYITPDINLNKIISINTSVKAKVLAKYNPTKTFIESLFSNIKNKEFKFIKYGEFETFINNIDTIEYIDAPEGDYSYLDEVKGYLIYSNNDNWIAMKKSEMIENIKNSLIKYT